MDNSKLKARIDRIRELSAEDQGSTAWYEAAGLAQAALHDTVGGHHPLMAAIRNALETSNFYQAVAASRAVVRLFDEGGLTSPRLAIAHELEGDLINIAQSQVELAERSTDGTQRQLHLAIAAFMAGAAVEDALRRLCDANGASYDAQRTSISKLQTALFQPSNGITFISSTENKQLTSWGDTRNKADHGKFSELTQSEVLSMVVGVRGFVDKYLP